MSLVLTREGTGGRLEGGQSSLGLEKIMAGRNTGLRKERNNARTPCQTVGISGLAAEAGSVQAEEPVS